MIRQTSREAYHQIVDEGLIGKLKLQVYELLFVYGPLTSSELFSKAKEIHGEKLRDTYQQRLSELREMGLVKETCERRCRITGRNVIEWDVTDQLPQKKKVPEKPIYRHWCEICDQSFEVMPVTHKQKSDDLFSPICIGKVTKWKKCD